MNAHPAPRKTVIVTGGAGFLGSHLCERLLADDHHVRCVDNFYSGTKDNLACPASPVHEDGLARTIAHFEQVLSAKASPLPREAA